MRNGGRLTLAEFVGRGDEPSGWTPPCRLAFFEYDRLHAMYQEVFGPDRVLVLPLELLAADQESFTRAILDFAGLADPARPTPRVGRETVRPRWGPVTVAMVRRLNGMVRGDPLGPGGAGAFRLVHRLAGRLDRLVPRRWQAGPEARQRAAIAARVGQRFEAPNRRLAVRIGMDLSRFGYYPSGEPEQ